ncbi:MAG: hypothetical protein MJB57_02885, partial [Gemmatimonadetes bacterium]|nr:hypothetical protein [Gemmatimonadota bacterium]
VGRALSHPVLRQAAAASPNDRRREVPIVYLDDDGTLVEGVADLAFRVETDDAVEWVVVDYKTDRDPGASRPIYEAQVGGYVRALERATGEAARGVVLSL